MPKFNLDDYEMVKDRIPLFFAEYPDGRINTEIISESANGVTIKAYLYKSLEEQVSCAPVSTGIAREVPGGFIDKYYENCETSSIGRALANINLYSGDRPSFEEMNSAKSMKETKKTNTSVSEPSKTAKKDIVISDPGAVATEKQAIWLKRFAQANIINYDDVFDEDGNVIITKGLASDMMDDAFPKYNEWQEKKKKENSGLA
jgi:hypothetical protein